MITKRLKMSLIGGIILGLFCVVGAYIRSGFDASVVFVFALWYNRVIMGLVIGAAWPKVTKKQAVLRGAVLGLLVSFAFYATSGYVDVVSFLAGIVYGIILELWLKRYE